MGVIADKIRRAIFGGEVRDSIADGIEVVEQLREDYDNQVINAGNSNAEIVDARGGQTKLKDRLDNFDEQLETKAKQTDLEVQKARIDSFTSLTQGSTTGDAELIDARVGADGVIYSNLGDANRTQFKKINENIFKTTRLLTDVSWVLKHIDVTGDIVDNGGKNVVTEKRNLLKKGDTITVDDKNYKFQIALYDKTTSVFIKREAWMQYGYVYELDNDYLVRIEISDINESVQTDISISNHVKVLSTESMVQKNAENIQNNTNNIQINANNIQKNTDSIQNLSNGITEQISNIIDIIGIDLFKRKTICITKENKYSAWPMISIANNKLVCLYTRINYHEDYSGSVICTKTSTNGVIWGEEKILLTNSSTRTSITGKGIIGDKALFWLRTNGSPTKYELYSMDNSGTFIKISNPTFDFDYAHIGDIINIPSVGLLSFYNTYETNRKWGVIVSTDNGVTWNQTYEEVCSSNSECPTEISGVYLQDGKILAIGRKDINGNTNAQFQIQSNDYGRTWSITYTNITDIALSTASLIYNSETNEISNYYFDRGTALKVRKNNVNDIWDNPTNWSNSEKLVNTCGNVQDEGNVNAIEYNGNHIVTYYSGNSTNTGIYEIII